MGIQWLESVYGSAKPIVAMCHLDALPGDPSYDRAKGMGYVIDRAYENLRALQDGGVDAVMFSNEFSLPYLTKTDPITAIAMARIIGELKSEIRIPFGVNVLWDADSSSPSGGVLIDPMAYGGHAETDLAMLQLFGYPYLEDVLAGYDEASPLASGWRERVGLHQLAPLLLHCMLFGSGYVPETLDTARHYL